MRAKTPVTFFSVALDDLTSCLACDYYTRGGRERIPRKLFRNTRPNRPHTPHGFCRPSSHFASFIPLFLHRPSSTVPSRILVLPVRDLVRIYHCSIIRSRSRLRNVSELSLFGAPRLWCNVYPNVKIRVVLLLPHYLLIADPPADTRGPFFFSREESRRSTRVIVHRNGFN